MQEPGEPQETVEDFIALPPATGDDPYSEVRRAAVEQINRDRLGAGLPAVELDLLSSEVGDRHCQEMAAYRYLSHWNLRGLLPYHRYHLAGGRDHVQENSSRLTVISSEPDPISTEPEEILPHLLRAHERMVAERPPVDGHRKNILDPGHTHVGIGLAVVGGEFVMTQQFVNRYVRLQELPDILPKKRIEVRGEVLQKDFGPYYCVLFHEEESQRRTVEELNQTYAYSDTIGEMTSKVSSWEMQLDRSRGRFRFAVPVPNSGPGYYHLLLWVRRPIRSIPYELHPGGTYNIDTKNGIPCAGWVFRQE